jgi:hypothetical protein
METGSEGAVICVEYSATTDEVTAFDDATTTI